jgi:hypothetical protein
LPSVDPRLRESLARAKTEFEAAHPGYTLYAYSGHRWSKGQGPHGTKTGAVDVMIRDPNGKDIPNEGGDKTGLYSEYARRTYGHVLVDHPELKDWYEWGGSFGTQRPSGGPPDLMHHDLSGARGKTYPEYNIRKLGPIYPDPKVASTTTPNSDANQPTTSGSPSVASQPSNQSVSPSVASQPSDQSVAPSVASKPSDQPVNVAPEKQYLPPGVRSAPSGETPKAVVIHNTGDRNSPAKTVESWRSETGDRKGVGAQYIVDRDGTIHDVLKDYKYGGTDNVARKYTPQELIDKGLVNRNFVGIEVVARNDQDTTPAQRAAVKKLIKQNYSHSRVMYHGELNPMYDKDAKGPHRPPTEGKRIADEINAERRKDPDYVEPGSAAEHLKKHFEESEKPENKRPGSVINDPQSDRINVAQNLTGSLSDANPLLKQESPQLTPLQQKATDEEDRQQSRIFTEGLTKVADPENFDKFLQSSPKSSHIDDRRDAQYDPGTGYPMKLWTAPGHVSSLYDTRTGELIMQGGSPLRRVYGWEDEKGDLTEEGAHRIDEFTHPGQVRNFEPPDKDSLKIDDTKTQGGEGGDAASFLTGYFKKLQAQREAGGRSTAGMVHEAKNQKVTTPTYEDPYAPAQPTKTTIYYTDPVKGAPTATYTDPASGLTYTDRSIKGSPLGPPAMSTWDPGKKIFSEGGPTQNAVYMPDYIPSIAYGHFNFAKGGHETLAGYWLVTPTEGRNKGQSFIWRQTDLGPYGTGNKNTAKKTLDANPPVVASMYGPDYFDPKKDIPGGTYIKFLGPTIDTGKKRVPGEAQVGEYLEPGPISPEDAKQFDISPAHRRYINEQAAWRTAMNRPEEDDSPFKQISKDPDKKTDIANKGDQPERDTTPYKNPSKDPENPSPRTSSESSKQSQRTKVKKPDDSQFDVKKEDNTEHHAEHDPSPSKDDDSDSTVSNQRGGGGSGGQELNI